MAGHRGEEGAALILLLGIVGALAILAATLVMVIANQQRATASERTQKTSLNYAEAALDNAVAYAKTNLSTHPMTSASNTPWLTPGELAAAFPVGTFPAGATVTYRIYDDLNPVVYTTTWDQGGPTAATANTPDQMMWVEVTVTTAGAHGKTSRVRVLVKQSQETALSSFPRAVVYSDTDVSLLGTSNAYSVDTNGGPWTKATRPTSVMAGGSFAATSASLKGPGSQVQSIGINVNGTVTPSTYEGIAIGGVGLLSDYFDQSIQASLQDEAQAGATHASAPPAPQAPAAPAPTPTTTPKSSVLSGWTNTSLVTPVDVSTTDYKVKGDLTLSRGTATAKRTFKFRKLYVTGNLTLTGPVEVTCADFLRVDGTITIKNTTANTTPVVDTFTGPVYVAGTSASSVAGNVTVSALSSFYTRGELTLSNTTTSTPLLYTNGALKLTGNAPVTAASVYSGGALTISGATSTISDQFGSVYVAGSGASSVSGTVTLNATSSLYSAGDLTMGNTAAATAVNIGLLNTPASPGLLYSAGDLTLSGNVTAKTRALVVMANSEAALTISDATAAGNITDYFGSVYCAGDANWSGVASVNTTDWTNPLPGQPAGSVWVRRLLVSGIYHHVLGPTWVNGYADGSTVVGFTGPNTPGLANASTVMCPLLATTEQTTIRGNVYFGTRAQPMTYYMVCDNDGRDQSGHLAGYQNTCDWGSTGTFYGLMLLMEARIEFSGGSATTPSLEGAVFCGVPGQDGALVNDLYLNQHSDIPANSDITLSGASTVAYNQAVIDAVTNTSLTTTTTATRIVPGSWQQLSAN